MTDFTKQSPNPSTTSIEKIKQFARECTALAQNTPNAPDIFAQLETFNATLAKTTPQNPYSIFI